MLLAPMPIGMGQAEGDETIPNTTQLNAPTAGTQHLFSKLELKNSVRSFYRPIMASYFARTSLSAEHSTVIAQQKSHLPAEDAVPRKKKWCHKLYNLNSSQGNADG